MLRNMADKPAAASVINNGAKNKDIPSFLFKVYEIIEDSPDGLVSWAEDGRSFVVTVSIYGDCVCLHIPPYTYIICIYIYIYI